MITSNATSKVPNMAAEKMNAVRSYFHALIFPTTIMNPAMRMKLAT